MARRKPPPGCGGCVHLDFAGCCAYLNNTGHRRGCPAGEGCTVKDTGPREPRPLRLPPVKEPRDHRLIGQNRRAPVGELLSADRRVLELYAAGGTDPEIARLAGCSPSSVRKWRHATGRPANRRSYESKRREDRHGNEGSDPAGGPG